jgi:hypothetical protein
MRISPDLSLEIPLWQAGHSRLAGWMKPGVVPGPRPVYAAAVILPPAGESC